MKHVKDQLFDQKVLSYFKISGATQEIRELKELLQMIASVPAGQKILQGIVDRGKAVKLFFVPNLNQGKYEFGMSGQYFWGDNSVKLLKDERDLSDVPFGERIPLKINQACILAHELQHSADGSINKWLDWHATNINESVLTKVLAEAHAFLNEDQLDRELRAQYGLLGTKMVRGKKEMESVTPHSPARRKDAIKRALSGESPMFKGYMNGVRRITSRQKYRARDLKMTALYRTTVEAYLQEMHVAMTFDEAMGYIKDSLKLLPATPTHSSNTQKTR